MQRMRYTMLWSSLLCLALAPIAFAGPGGTYGPSQQGSGGTGYRGYGSGFGGGFNQNGTSIRTPSGYFGSKYPSGSAVIQVRPTPNTVITIQPGTKPGYKPLPHYENLPGHNHPGGYVPKPVVVVKPNYGTPGSGGRPGYGNNSGYNHRPNYYNGGWYHGDWHGNWNNSWKSRPYSWGGWNSGKVQVSRVTIGSPWRYGYWSYSNPYYKATANIPAHIDYSHPILATTYVDASGVGVNSATQERAMREFGSARAAFFAGDLIAAETEIDHALALTPNDTVMHEFRALVLFASRQYGPAAGTIYALLSSGPGWDWTTLIGLYPSVEVYTQQLRTLERFCLQNPRASEAHFLLAYHYLTAGHTEAAAEEYQQILATNPRDSLSAQLLASLTSQNGAAPIVDLRPDPQFQQIDLRYLVGNWAATRNDGSNFNLSLGPDRTYRWRFSQGGRPEEFSGTYTIADNVLVLKQDDEPAMVGQITPLARNRFNFRLLGGDASDPGLNFTR